MESKKDRFKRIAEARTNKAIDMIRLLGNCANKKNYDYSKDEVDKIIRVLESEIKDLKNKFNDSLKSNEKFKL